ncbi:MULTISPECIES: hypothetical protein [Ralstonia solanacearum species complex]|uniref:hypothetical protein n=1 Tax=Ralstonia solanacearum species complex TaxID=3116862 RepID=UPI000E580F9D|nr:hypothetical protein [Ralstonia solanacearum]BEU71906.1 hypothetical protein MAFF211271_14610 [Ralstonia pseudosolanacearum]AXV76820.1 hypothetical protein CJO76_07430 [Ralstonia solanacearum]AXV90834.1 hypothetical protein CJO79_07415 [Ralstonia solanacearum]AXW18989.1 hypothetical protein CJO85_07460 [Ralstonia solanacearum]AXW75746.1 hypothetical protein CJO97_07410 [Ralstonia solanacearum]
MAYLKSGNVITVPVYTTQTVTDTAEVSTYDAAGNALGYRVTQNGTTTDYTFSQALYEGYQEGGVSVVSSAGSPNYTSQGNFDLGYQPVTITAGSAEFVV